MAAEFSVDITGLENVIENIHIFHERLQQKGVRAACRKAMIPVRDDARRRAFTLDDEKTSNRIWQNIVINESQRGGQRVGGVVMRVGVRGGSLAYVERTLAGGTGRRHVLPGEKRPSIVKVFKPIKRDVTHPGGDTRYWRYQELGTKYIRARHFMLPALMENTNEVVNELTKELNAQIDKMGSLMQFIGPKPKKT